MIGDLMIGRNSNTQSLPSLMHSTWREELQLSTVTFAYYTVGYSRRLWIWVTQNFAGKMTSEISLSEILDHSVHPYCSLPVPCSTGADDMACFRSRRKGIRSCSTYSTQIYQRTQRLRHALSRCHCRAMLHSLSGHYCCRCAFKASFSSIVPKHASVLPCRHFHPYVLLASIPSNRDLYRSHSIAHLHPHSK